MTDFFSYLQGLDIFSWQIISLLLVAGFMVGFINTMAGSGTVITYSLFMALGLSPQMANGTIRLGVIMQTLSASFNFKKHNILDLKQGLWYGIPVMFGSITGAQIAVSINKEIFEIIIGIIMLIMLVFILLKPERWIKGKHSGKRKKPGLVLILIFYLIGVYGGFIHIGVGIFLLAALVINAGYDLLTANALKVFIVLLYSPFALAVFMFYGHVHYVLGSIAAIGNVAGGYVASKYALSWGAGIIRWILVVVILLFASKLLGLYNLFL
ncbi:MAG: sulfite exporter TauE/SafE family protein [Bacteroidales bacterium]|nr:sulfite exporter TauE/SafE family protein [Bacteroidales bacterium]